MRGLAARSALYYYRYYRKQTDKMGIISAPTPEILPRQDRANGVVGQIGNTPLLRLTNLPRLYGINPRVELYAKAEWFNPSGSVKDRAALYMIRDGEERELLVPGRIILEASSGNMGISLAMIGSALGYPVEICLPAIASPERKRLLKLYGASIIETPALLGIDGAIEEARRHYALAPERYFYPDQYGNPANWQAHFHGTGPEIWGQTSGRVTHFVAVVGTSGTFTGTARRLKEYNPAIKVVEVQPDSAFHGLEGMKHMPSALVPGIYDPNLADKLLDASTEEAQATTRALARHEGILTGPSGGAAVLTALRIAQTLSEGVVVTVLPDGGSRYLGDSFWDEQ
jgi:cysteine synthase B